jgi:hypothetical protein
MPVEISRDSERDIHGSTLFIYDTSSHDHRHHPHTYTSQVPKGLKKIEVITNQMVIPEENKRTPESALRTDVI